VCVVILPRLCFYLSFFRTGKCTSRAVLLLPAMTSLTSAPATRRSSFNPRHLLRPSDR